MLVILTFAPGPFGHAKLQYNFYPIHGLLLNSSANIMFKTKQNKNAPKL